MNTSRKEGEWSRIDGTKWRAPDGREYTIEPMRITREWAQEMLDGSDGTKESRNFRKATARKVLQLAREMDAGRWKFNGEAVVFDADGYCRDGQKRLRAVIETGKPIDALVVWGVTDDADLTMDRGEKRTLARYLTHMGEHNCTILQAALTWLWKIQNNKEQWSDTPEISEAVELLRSNTGIRESVTYVHGMPAGTPESMCAAVHYLCTVYDRGKADKFFDLLKSGAGLAENDPILRFRTRMIESKTGKAVLPGTEKIALLILAWNKWVEGMPVRFLRWRAIGPAAEPFPKLNFPSEPRLAARSA